MDNRSVPKMMPGHAALIGLMDRYLRSFLDPFVALLEVHKLMYFMQTAVEPLRLQFAKEAYGPYAENLRHVLNDIEGHFISGYVDGGDPYKPLNLVPGALEDACVVLQEESETQERFERVCDLVVGFESPFGLELLTSVHWVVTREGADKLDDVIRKIYDWNERKKRFTERQIKLAVNVLSEKG